MKRISTFLISMVVIVGIYTACTKEAKTEPSFVFKPATDKNAVTKIKGKTYSYDDVFGDIKGEIFEKETELYELKFNKIKSFALKAFVESDPRSKGLTNDEFFEKYIGQVKEPSKKEIEDFIKERNLPKAQVNKQVEMRIKNYLELQKRKEAVDQWLSKQMSKNPVEVYISKPARPVFNINVTDEDPYWGDKNAKVTLVEFSDFQCPFCAKGAERVGEIKKKYGKKIKIVFKHFPLPFHHHAKDAAMASMCAAEQGMDKFWKAHDYMFANQTKLKTDDLKNDLPKEAGVDSKKFSECVDAKKYMAKVESDIEEGKKNHVKATPTFFVNGELVSGARSLEEFSEVIDKHL